MKKADFKKLKINDFFHDLGDNSEFKVVEFSPPDIIIGQCINSGISTCTVGMEYHFVAPDKNLRAGKLPIKETCKVTAPMFQELTISEAIKQGLVKKGDKVSIELEFVEWNGEP